jgi:hypothetical protein
MNLGPLELWVSRLDTSRILRSAKGGKWALRNLGPHELWGSRLERGRERDVSSGRLAQRTHFLPHGWHKMLLGRSWVSFLKWVPWTCGPIFFLLAGPNCDLARSRMLWYNWPCELIFCPLDDKKYDLGEDEKEMFQGGHLAMRTHFLQLWRHKMRHVICYDSSGPDNSFYDFWSSLNATRLK